MRGTIVNVVAVLVGSGIGLAVGNRLPERLQRIITTGLGLSTLLGAQLAFLLRPEILNELTATGGLLILAIGFLLLDVKRVRVANLLPALVVVILLTAARLSLGW